MFNPFDAFLGQPISYLLLLLLALVSISKDLSDRKKPKEVVGPRPNPNLVILWSKFSSEPVEWIFKKVKNASFLAAPSTSL